jgi:signal transduction histidine kinase
VTIEVQDDGPGIPESEKQRALEPFYRGDASRGLNDNDSFGLGLSIARSISESHGGNLELIDAKPQGLLVRLTLARQSS